MSIRRTLVVSVALCLVSLNLAGTPHAQSLGELAGAEKERRAAVAENRAKLAAAEAKRQADLLAAEVKRQAAFAATPEGKRQAAIEKARVAAAEKVASEKVPADKLEAEKASASGRSSVTAAAEKTNSAQGNGEREELIKAQFSLWDGSHTKLTKAIKDSMSDPSSYKHITTTYNAPPGDRLVITTTFRGKNASGAVVTNIVMAIVDMSGTVLDMKYR